MSRTALDGFPFGDVEKDELVKIIKKFSKLFFVEVFGFCIMGNHFHLLIQMFPENYFKDEEIRKRCKAHYGEDFELSDEQICDYRVKLSKRQYRDRYFMIDTKLVLCHLWLRFLNKKELASYAKNSANDS